MKRTIFWGIALLFLPIFILIDLGRGAEPGFLKRPLSFQQVTAKDGLSSEMVMAVAAVGEEVWFGTYAGGVTLYDRAKKTFKTYTTKGEPQEKDDGVSIKWKNHPAYNHVSVILPDKDRVWFGTYFYGFGGGGISYYMPRKKNPWRRFTTNKDVAKKIVSLAADGDLLYAGSEKGLSILDKKTEKWQSFYSTERRACRKFCQRASIAIGYPLGRHECGDQPASNFSERLEDLRATARTGGHRGQSPGQRRGEDLGGNHQGSAL